MFSYLDLTLAGPVTAGITALTYQPIRDKYFPLEQILEQSDESSYEQTVEDGLLSWHETECDYFP